MPPPSRSGLAAGLLLLLAAPAPAGVLAYDAFDYAPGPPMFFQNGGTGFLGPYALGPTAGSAGAAAGGLGYGGLDTSGNRTTFTLFFPFDDVGAFRRLAAPLGTPGTTAYVSFLVRPDTPQSPGRFGLALGSELTPTLFLGASDGEYAVEEFGGAGRVSSGVAAAAGETAFLVARLDFAAGNDTVRLYVNPTPGGPEPAAASAAAGGFDVGAVQALQFRAIGGGFGGPRTTVSFDEIRVGTTFADVTPAAVPEPASLTLAAAGVAALLAAGGRRRPGDKLR